MGPMRQRRLIPGLALAELGDDAGMIGAALLAAAHTTPRDAWQ